MVKIKLEEKSENVSIWRMKALVERRFLLLTAKDVKKLWKKVCVPSCLRKIMIKNTTTTCFLTPTTSDLNKTR